MTPRSSFAFFLVLAALVVTGGTALVMQWRQSMELRVAFERARIEADDLARLREDNRRLLAQQIPPTELARLRSDRAALSRLRAELETLQHSSPATP